MILKNIYEELVLIRKELQAINGCMEPNSEYVTLMKANYLKNRERISSLSNQGEKKNLLFKKFCKILVNTCKNSDGLFLVGIATHSYQVFRVTDTINIIFLANIIIVAFVIGHSMLPFLM